MDNKNIPDIGRIMNDALQDALRTGDFSRLRQTVNTTVNTVVDKTISCAKSAEGAATRIFDNGRKSPPGWGPGGWDPRRVQEPRDVSPPSGNAQRPAAPPHSPPYRQPNTGWQEPVKQAPQNPWQFQKQAATSPVVQKNIITVPAYLRKRTPNMICGVLMAIAGFLAAVPSGMTALAIAIRELPHGFRILPVAGFSVLAVVSVLSLVLAITGLRLFGRAKRFGRYWSLVREKGFCEVKTLAEAIEKKPRFVVRDLTRMLGAGMIPGGRLDDEKTCLIVGESLYQQYRETQKSLEQRQKITTSDNSVIAAGLDVVRQIRSVNAALPGAVITEKLTRLEDVTASIFAYVEQRPEKLPEIRRFMDYYLPTTLKMVKSYQDFEAQTETASIAAAKAEILATLDTISAAFETLLDGLYQDDTMDVSTDISVLKTMLAQEGLTKNNDFKK